MKKIFLLFLFLAQFAIAQNAVQQQIINDNQERPSVELLVSTPQALDDFANNGYDNDSQSPSRVPQIRTNIDEFIVSLEKVHPGATYAFLGRDMDLIADAVDAYYQSIGQNGRVKRIKFSTPSLQNSNPDLITRFLAQLGMNTDATGANPKNFVILDYTKYGAYGRTNTSFPSQARYIYESVVQKLKASGLDYDQIVRRVTVATLDPTASNSVTTGKALNLTNEDVLAKQAASLKQTGKINFLPIIGSRGDAMAYGSEWNDKYGPIKDVGGKLVTVPGQYFTNRAKTGVYWQMIQVIKEVTSPSFASKIENLAKANGVVFTVASPAKKVQAKKVPPVKPENFAAKMNAAVKKLKSTLPVFSAAKDYDKFKFGSETLKLTANGNEVAKILADPNFQDSNNFAEKSVQMMIDLYETDQLGARDFRRLFIFLLGFKEIESKNFLNMIKSNYETSYPLQITLGREDEVEKYSKAGGFVESNFNRILNFGSLGLKCRFSYQ